MMKKNQFIGALGEKIAADFLEKKGLAIIDHNFYTRVGEIDLIARDGDKIVFVEVKTRKGEDLGLPEEAINFSKQEKIVRAAHYYLWQNDLLDKEYRFDAVSIILDEANQPKRIDYYANIINL